MEPKIGLIWDEVQSSRIYSSRIQQYCLIYSVCCKLSSLHVREAINHAASETPLVYQVDGQKSCYFSYQSVHDIPNEYPNFREIIQPDDLCLSKRCSPLK